MQENMFATTRSNKIPLSIGNEHLGRKRAIEREKGEEKIWTLWKLLSHKKPFSIYLDKGHTKQEELFSISGIAGITLIGVEAIHKSAFLLL